MAAPSRLEAAAMSSECAARPPVCPLVIYTLTAPCSGSETSHLLSDLMHSPNVDYLWWLSKDLSNALHAGM